MGYSLYLGIDTGDVDFFSVCELPFSYTAREMLAHAFNAVRTANPDVLFADFKAQGIHIVSGMQASTAAPILKAVIEQLKDNENTYKGMAGYSHYHGVMNWVDDIYRACVQHPLCTVVV